MSDQEEEECDFQVPVNLPLNMFGRKRQRSQADGLEYEPNEEYLVETSVCTLCQSDWTNNGSHGIVGLKCGHVFGKDCIDKHIRSELTKNSVAKCPKCDKIVSKKESRRIWPNKVIPCEVEDLIVLRKESEEADIIIAQLEEANKLVLGEIDQIKFELNLLASESQYKTESSQPVVPPPMKSSPSKFIYQHSFSLKNETYRVMDIVPLQDMAVLSVWNKPKQQYGLRKVNLYDPTQTEFIPNHNGPIKDIKNVLQDKVLSTGLDKTLKITSLTSNQVVQSYKLDAPGWSCTSDSENLNLMYCGLTNNTVLVFDIRNTKEYVHKLIEPCEPKIYSPVHSLDVIQKENASMIICSNLTHIYGWKVVEKNYEYTPFECTEDYKSFNTSYQDDVLMSSLRNKTSTRYEIRQFDSELNLKFDWCFTNENHQQLSLSRNTHLKRGDRVFMCTSEDNKIKIRDQQKEVQLITVNGSIVDTKYVKEQDVLTILTEDEFSVFKFC